MVGPGYETGPAERRTSVCVAGGGPAGMVLGLLLARAGIEVTVLEKHSDFLRDFRGDTLHPTTLDLLADLGLIDAVRAVPHSEVDALDAVVDGVRFRAADFRGVGRAGRLWFMPQWDLLDVLATAAAAYPTFTLLMDTAALAVVDDGRRVTGVEALGPDGSFTIRADLVVGADGRRSTLRTSAGLPLVNSSVPIDVLWFRVGRPEVNPADTIAYLGADTVITIPRTDYYQCALLIGKGTLDRVHAAGLDAFRTRVVRQVPFLAPSIDSVRDWDDVRLLDVQIAHAPRWHRDGLLLIGDAAHPMSPAFGVGINYAIQDAVATARVIGRRGVHDLTERDLRRVQRRRAPAARAMQLVQGAVHRTTGRLNASRLPRVTFLRLVIPVTSPLTRRLAGRLVGAGLRPERLDF